MTEEILKKAIELEESLKNDPRVILLNKLEEEMSNDEDVMRLSYIKDVKNDKYNEMKKYFNDDSEEVANSLKEFYEAKKELESHPKVKAYLKAYQEVRMLLDEINRILFEDYNSSLCKRD